MVPSSSDCVARFVRFQQALLTQYNQNSDFKAFTRAEGRYIHIIIQELKRLNAPRDLRIRYNNRLQTVRCRRTRDFLWLLDPRCQLCLKPFLNKKEATIDHIIPKVKGGKNEAGNKQLAHTECNNLKGEEILPIGAPLPWLGLGEGVELS